MSFLARFAPIMLVRRVRARLTTANWEFWIGNFFVVFSTVLGVYLAAHTALETAMEFESLRGSRDAYYLRTSLRNEVAGNMDALDGIAAIINEHGWRYRENDSNFPQMRFFVWEAMKTSPQTLSTPPQILSGVQTFNEEAKALLKSANGGGMNVLYFATLLGKLTEKHRDEIIETIDEDLAALREELTEAGLDLRGDDVSS